jgi:hypothetical protein
MNLQFILVLDYTFNMTLSRAILNRVGFLQIIGISITISSFFTNISFGQSKAPQTTPKEVPVQQLIERFSPDLNIQAKQQKRRLDGYQDHNADARRFDRIRESGEIDYNEDLLRWSEEREFLTKKYKNEKALEAKNIGKRIKEQEQHERAISQEDDAHTKSRKNYIVAREKIKADSIRKFSEEQELKIFATRPRYDDKKRTLYGAKTNYAAPKSFGGSSGGSPVGGMDDSMPSAPPVDSGNMDYFPPPPPPPPPMDDYNIPPPPPSDEYGNPVTDFGMPPPPPPDFNPGGY